MADLSSKNASTGMKLTGNDELLNADVSSVDSKNAVHVTVHDDDSGDGIAIDPRPLYSLVHVDGRLTNASSTDMTVNGSSTAVDFVAGPPAGQIWYVSQISILIDDVGSSDGTDFGSITGGLTNGVQVIQDVSSTEYVLTNMQDNHDLALCFSQHPLLPIRPGGEGSAAGFLDGENIYMGTKNIEPYVKLVGDNSDQLIFRVRDNLTTVGSLEAMFRAWRKL